MVHRQAQLLKSAALLYISFLAVYTAGMADRLVRPSIYNHSTYLADSFLHGQLEMTREPPHQNDWSYYDGRWYVSFPPVPALLMMPCVALWGWDANTPSPVPEYWQRPGREMGRYRFNEPVFILFLTPLPPLLLFLILERLRRTGRSRRNSSENMLLTILFGLGTVYFPAAVQADTWHLSHVVGCTFFSLYILSSIEGRHPCLSALCLGLAFGSRTPMIFAFPFFLYELLRREGVNVQGRYSERIRAFFRLTIISKVLLFSLVLGLFVFLWLAMNEARFGDPFDFGHRHLQVRWLPRIQRWGLFDLHYLSRNLAAAFVLMPWFTEEFPYFELSHHGMALWLTTPVLLYLLWPQKQRLDPTLRQPGVTNVCSEQHDELHKPLWICVALVALPSLLYQNTGWVQFGYRFSNDYMIFFMMLLAVGDRKFTRFFKALIILSITVNFFGAVTLNRVPYFYNQDLSQQVFFQPD